MQVNKHDNGGPWGSGPGNDDKNPWGRRQGRGNDVDDLIDSFQRRLKGMMRGGPGGGSGGNSGKVGFKAFFVLIGVALLLWLSTGFYRVEIGELGVVLRFGQLNRTVEPGLHYRIPSPVEEIIIRNVVETKIITSGQSASTSDGESETNLMLTGDEGIVQTSYTILWRIQDIAKFLFVARDPESTIRVASESALRGVLARTTSRNAIAEGRTEVQKQAQIELQKILDAIDMGVMVVEVQLQDVKTPKEVTPAFNDVQGSNVDRNRLILEAQAYRDDIIPRARGLVKKIEQDSIAESEREIAEAEGVAQKMSLITQAAQDYMDVTLMRERLRAMDAATKDSNITIVDKKLGGILPHMSINSKNAPIEEESK